MVIISEVTISGDWKLVLVIIPVGLAWWWLAKQYDIHRIRAYGSARGWRFEKISYDFFGTAGDEEAEGSYAVRYLDERGVLTTARCKICKASGVFFTDVVPAGLASAPLPIEKFAVIDCPRCGSTVGAAEAECSHCQTPRREPTGAQSG